MQKWYTFHSKPNTEYQVEATLRQRGFQTYLPEIEVAKPRRGNKKTEPLFPCYLFSKFDFEVVGNSQVQWVPGLRRIVSIDDRPIPLPDEAIDLIRRKLGEVKSAGSWPKHAFNPGDAVYIADGPFRDVEAIFEGPTTARERVQVLLNIFGRVSRMKVDVTKLKKADQGTKASKPKRPRRTRGRGRYLKNN